jgi:hypothetical protein
VFSVVVLQVEAEVVDAASIKYEIASVPTFILLKVCSIKGAMKCDLQSLYCRDRGAEHCTLLW